MPEQAGLLLSHLLHSHRSPGAMHTAAGMWHRVP